MKHLILSALLLAVSFSSFAQSQRPQPAPASPQNTIHFVYGQGDSTFVGRVCYSAYAEANAAAGDADVVFIGDSITQNWYAFHHGFFDNNGFLARGISGQTSIEILCRFQQDVVKHHPKVVVMMVGTNDVAGNVGTISDECYLDNIASACAIAKGNGIKMLLCSIPPCDFFFWSQDIKPGARIISLNEKLKAYAVENDIQYVDYFAVLNNGADGMIAEYTSDHCHPTPLGYNVMERLVVNEINKALGTETDYFVTTD
ncbi:MAG: GDSL-type esterase/lipase family protein [Bacteroidia bacterium]|nr:GDSL-type esterase/lipase family protein [Bacteroidia bacterium]